MEDGDGCVWIDVAGGVLNIKCLVIGIVGIEGVGGGHVGMPAGPVIFRDVEIEERFYVVLSHVNVCLLNNGTCEKACS